MSDLLPPVPFGSLTSSDLHLGRVYAGGTQPNVGADPLNRLMGVGNSGGIRYRNVASRAEPALCVLFSTGGVPEWPDGLDSDGNYVYFGDQRTAGKDIHDTALKGNRLFADVAALMRHDELGRQKIPPFFLFEKTGRGRDVRFEGLLVPAKRTGWLQVTTRSSDDGEFNNYKAVLARLHVDEASRTWLNELVQGEPLGSSAPVEWREWVRNGPMDS